MMSEFRFSIFLLGIAVAGLLSGSGASPTLKYVCPGDYVQAFENIKFDTCNGVVSLNINGERNTRIATWSWHNCTLNATLLPDYQERVFLNQTGSISISNIHHFDQGKYVVISQTDSLPMIYEVEIFVMVAPTKECKPKIARLETSLLTTLKNANDCGKPVATLYWKDNDDVSSTNKAKLKLTPGKEAGKYYACIEGPALDCVRNVTPHDYCSSYTIEGSNSPPISSETCNTTVFIVACIVLGVLLIVAITVTIIREFRRKKNIKSEEEVPLRDITQLWTEHFDTLNWENIKQLLNRDQQQGLQTYIDNMKSVKDNPRQVSMTHSGSEYKIEDASTEHRTYTGPEKVIEHIEPRNDDLCKICSANISNVSFLPCSHIATCASCSISLQECPVCRKHIKAVVKPYSN